jgi:hypothetical protein
MISPDFCERTYTAEVLSARGNSADVLQSIARLTHEPTFEQDGDQGPGLVKICHGFLPTTREHHRYSRTITLPDGTEITIPRRRRIRGRDYNLYDVLVAQCRHHVVVAVPFHELAEEFFLTVDNSLAGKSTRYERLDITALAMRLGSSGAAHVSGSGSRDAISLSVTRCHLTYTDQKNRTNHLQQIRINGSNLGLCDEYRTLVAPVLNPSRSDLKVTPVILGFALLSNGVRKSSATTDLHGNFKMWVAPGLRRLIRLFSLLDILEGMKNITSTTSNVPILQSRTIRDAEE